MRGFKIFLFGAVVCICAVVASMASEIVGSAVYDEYTIQIGTETNSANAVILIPATPARVEWGIEEIDGAANEEIYWYDSTFSSSTLAATVSTNPVSRPLHLDSGESYTDSGDYVYKGDVFVLPKTSTVTVQGWQKVR